MVGAGGQCEMKARWTTPYKLVSFTVTLLKSTGPFKTHCVIFLFLQCPLCGLYRLLIRETPWRWTHFVLFVALHVSLCLGMCVQVSPSLMCSPFMCACVHVFVCVCLPNL